MSGYARQEMASVVQPPDRDLKHVCQYLGEAGAVARLRGAPLVEIVIYALYPIPEPPETP